MDKFSKLEIYPGLKIATELNKINPALEKK